MCLWPSICRVKKYNICVKNTRQYFLGYVNNIPDRFCSSTKTILNRVLVTHNNSNFGAIFLINNLFSTFLKHALQTNRMTPVSSHRTRCKEAIPHSRYLFYYSLLLVGKGHRDRGTLYGIYESRSSRPILVCAQ